MDVLVYDAVSYARRLLLCISDECFINKVGSEKGDVVLVYHSVITDVYKIEPHGKMKGA